MGEAEGGSGMLGEAGGGYRRLGEAQGRWVRPGEAGKGQKPLLGPRNRYFIRKHVLSPLGGTLP